MSDLLYQSSKNYPDGTRCKNVIRDFSSTVIMLCIGYTVQRRLGCKHLLMKHFSELTESTCHEIKEQLKVTKQRLSNSMTRLNELVDITKMEGNNINQVRTISVKKFYSKPPILVAKSTSSFYLFSYYESYRILMNYVRRSKTSSRS